MIMELNEQFPHHGMHMSRLAFLPIFGARVERALQILKTNG